MKTKETLSNKKIEERIIWAPNHIDINYYYDSKYVKDFIKKLKDKITLLVECDVSLRDYKIYKIINELAGEDLI